MSVSVSVSVRQCCPFALFAAKPYIVRLWPEYRALELLCSYAAMLAHGVLNKFLILELVFKSNTCNKGSKSGCVLVCCFNCCRGPECLPVTQTSLLHKQSLSVLAEQIAAFTSMPDKQQSCDEACSPTHTHTKACLSAVVLGRLILQKSALELYILKHGGSFIAEHLQSWTQSSLHLRNGRPSEPSDGFEKALFSQRNSVSIEKNEEKRHCAERGCFCFPRQKQAASKDPEVRKVARAAKAFF